jgi:sugar lactone lactonase YvrE
VAEDFELLVHRRALCGAGPLWMSSLNALYWVDILRREVHLYHRDSGVDDVMVMPMPVSALGAARNGQLIAATASGFARLNPSRRTLDSWVEVYGGDRMNDGACDPAGRFLAGTVTLSRDSGRSALYIVDGQRARLVVAGLTLSNGIGWSPDGSTMYLVDTTQRIIWAYDYDVERGRVGAGRRWVVCGESEGDPDGLAVDADGCVWVAMHWTGRIHRYRPSGDLETVLWAPTSRVTSLAFGGRRLDEMYVTSSCSGYDEPSLVADPYAGALFRFSPGAVGRPVTPWNGG